MIDLPRTVPGDEDEAFFNELQVAGYEVICYKLHGRKTGRRTKRNRNKLRRNVRWRTVVRTEDGDYYYVWQRTMWVLERVA